MLNMQKKTKQRQNIKRLIKKTSKQLKRKHKSMFDRV